MKKTKEHFTYFMWVSALDCDPPHSLNLSTGSRDLTKVEGLVKEFINNNGFNISYPALVGYPLDSKIQLLSGTHRHEAAKRTGYKLPITMFLRSYVEAYWGTNNWINILQDISVIELSSLPRYKDKPPGLLERYQPNEL